MLLSTHLMMEVWEDVWVTNIVVELNGNFVYVIWRAGIGEKIAYAWNLQSLYVVWLPFINSHV